MKKFFTISTLFLPICAFAAAPTNFREIVTLLLYILQNIISVLFASIVVGILYAVTLYMLNSDNEKKREQIKPYLIYGIVGLSVCMGMWGLIGILTSTVFGGAVGIPLISPPK